MDGPIYSLEQTVEALSGHYNTCKIVPNGIL